ncbi:MAG: NAD/NADP octopine/nopaline dehydrogenase family protein [Candidatus Gastranaerophilales bacterium]|nr:NAD/NADP octopine/nopaline dehydrogenase family protein [Candidatus Gastranaerophilales bacterium]
MKITVLGSGHGGFAMASDLSHDGYDVVLSSVYPHNSKLKMFKIAGKIKIEGMFEKYEKPVMVNTSYIEEDTVKAIERADIIFINTPAFAQEVYEEMIGRYGHKGQIIVFPCGGFSAVNCKNYFKNIGREDDFVVCETGSFIYTTKLKGNDTILIKSMKSKVMFGCVDNEKTDYALGIINKIYPQFYKAENVWQTSFSNPSSVLHTITTLLNMSRIEQLGSYQNSFYDITPSVARVMEKVDKERCEIAGRFFKKVMNVSEIMCSLYNLHYDNIYDTIKHISAFKIQYAPGSMQHRYVSEDVPYSMVPIATIGKKLGIPTPNMDSIINIACMANDTDYWQEGRNADKIGFSAEQALYSKEMAAIR